MMSTRWALKSNRTNIVRDKRSYEMCALHGVRGGMRTGIGIRCSTPSNITLYTAFGSVQPHEKLTAPYWQQELNVQFQFFRFFFPDD